MSNAVQLGLLAVSAIIIIGVIIYVVNQNGKNNFCKAFIDPKSEEANATRGAVGARDLNFDDIMGNFYVKSSYNSCATGEWSHGFVDTCALKYAISLGCRFLDFEIYDIEGEPVVAMSQTLKYGSKNSYNHVALVEALKVVEAEAFSENNNGNDPLFLNFRFATQHPSICDKVANLLTDARFTTMTSRLMPPQFSAMEVEKNREADMQNLTQSETPKTIQDVPLKNLVQKVIILVDFGKHANRQVTTTKLFELVNVCQGDFQGYSYNEMLGMGPADIQAQALNYLAMASPDNSANAIFRSDNPEKVTPFSNGVQFCAMNVQTNDDVFKMYSEFFELFAFVRKPENLRRDKNANKVELPPDRPPAPPVDITTSSGQRVYIPSS